MTSRSRSGGAPVGQRIFRWAKFAILLVLVAAMPKGARAAAAPPAPSQAAAVAPAGWLEQAQRNLAEREYEVSWQAKPVLDDLSPSWHAPNRAHGFRTYFTPDGIRVVPRTESAPSWRWGLSLVGYGNAETTWSVPGANLAPTGHRMSYHRGALEEFYVNTLEGLEQGFILPAPPGGADSSDMVHLDLALWGDLSPRISEDGQAIDFVTAAGAPVLHYAQLKVTDARESVLPSWMEGFTSEGVRGIRIVVDARQAVYPVTIDPLSTGWAWTGVGGQANVYYGAPVATAGDVNGDGYSDVIVGASFYDNGQTDEGRAILYLGSASGPGTIANWTAESNQDNAHFGYPVATAGDVNGDGYADVIVGANGYSNTLSGAGRTYLYLGSASGLATTPAWTADGDQANAGLGLGAATAGDVNGDGYSDVVVGAWRYDNSELDAGRAYLYLGSASGLATTPAWTADGDQPGAEFGFPITTAGDVNGDGYADVIVGASLYDNGQPDEGRAYLYLGSASGLATTPAWTAESDQGSAQFGNSVSTAGDVNGDGFADVAVGARYYDNGQSNEGRAYVYLGSASGLATTAAWTAECDQANAHFGFTVATAGDVNGDGYADVIVGAELYSFGQANEGRAFVYLGAATGLATVPVWTAESDQAGAQFGQVVAVAGDVNGDGYSDVIVGAPNYDNVHFDEGRAYLYLGSAYGPSMTAAWTAQSDQAASTFAFAVATAGDVNGDGYADVIVGDPSYSLGDNLYGRAYLFLGSASGLAVTPAWVVDGFEFVGSFGISVGTAGDVNGDGYSDVIVGDYSQNGPGAPNTSQSARIFLGSATGLSPNYAWIASGPHIEARFGASVRTAGDVNGDGYDDVLVGAIWYSNGQSHEGAIFLYLGSATGPSGTVAWSVESNVANRNFGTSMGTAGDVNGDGYDDVIIGDPLHSNGQTNEGGAYLYLGSATGLSPTPVWSAESNQAEARFGTSVGTAGDVNGDGYADVIVGAPYYSAGQTNEGRAYVYLGSASGLASNPAWLADGQQDFARLGSSVGSAGDVNGDGYADAVVGAPFYSNGQAYEGRAYLFLGSAAGLPFTVGDWVVESDQVTAGFGAAVATAGDVNGDGFADVLVSASNFDNGGGIYGRLFAFYGNGGRGVTMRPRQRRSDDTAPIAPGGRSLAPGSFRIAAIGRTPFGRGRVRLEWEVKPLGTLFNGLGTQSSLTPIDTGTAGASLNELVSGLDSGAYHWRARLLYDTATTPLARKNRWFRVPWSGWQEMDLRLAALLGGWVWDDLDGDGMKQAGEPGHAGVVVNLKNPAGTTVDQRTTLADGFYNFGLAATGQFGLQFVVPAGTTLTLQDQGGDDAADSDANRVSGLTPLAGPTFTAADGTGWSAGLLTCGPLSPTTILGVRIAPGTAAVTIDFTDPNPPGLVLGYNLYRASQPQPSPELWVQLAYEVTDSDPASPNIQCMDPTSDIPPLGGVFYYKVTASNHVCGTEGPL